MSDITDVFMNFHTKMIEAQQTLDIYANHFRTNQSLMRTITNTKPYSVKSAIIVRAIHLFKTQTISYLNFLVGKFKPVSDFITLLNESDIN